MDKLAAAATEELAVRLRAASAPPRRVELACRAVRELLLQAVRPCEDGWFVVTGDIPAMWLRDSAAQVRPLLLLADAVPGLAGLVGGVLRVQVEQLLRDPVANAFNRGPTGAAVRRDFPDQSPWVFERKQELDSSCAPLSLAWTLWRTTGSLDHVDPRFLEAAASVIALLRREQEHDPAAYRLWRPLRPRRDSLACRGRGRPVARTGLVWSGFRPSDDACHYGFNVPANAFAAVTLERLSELLAATGSDPSLAAEAAALAGEIRAAILRHALVPGPDGEPVWAYELDGLGRFLLMDDANVPSLLSLPYLGFCASDDATYRATRRFVLGPANPWWIEGREVRGIGSPHTGRRRVWPLAIAMEGLTAGTPEARLDALGRIEQTIGPRWLTHESVHAHRPRRFTRRWFSWGDMAYVELALAAAGGVLPTGEARLRSGS